MEGERLTGRRPTGKCLTDGQGMSAMMTLSRYCREHEGCRGCIFGKSGESCVLKSVPKAAQWPEAAEKNMERVEVKA